MPRATRSARARALSRPACSCRAAPEPARPWKRKRPPRPAAPGLRADARAPLVQTGLCQGAEACARGPCRARPGHRAPQAWQGPCRRSREQAWAAGALQAWQLYGGWCALSACDIEAHHNFVAYVPPAVAGPYQVPGLRNGTAPLQHHRSSMVTEMRRGGSGAGADAYRWPRAPRWRRSGSAPRRPRVPRRPGRRRCCPRARRPPAAAWRARRM